MNNIYFLIDTNIFIQLEDDKIIKDSFARFHNLCNEHSAVICIHKLSKEEIEKDDNQNRKNNNLSKVKKYKLLEQLPSTTKNKLEQFFGTIKGVNDEIDCQLLFALKKESVSFLVTEDTGIHKRAKNSNLKNMVLTINQANNMLNQLFPKKIEISLPKIENPYIYNIEYNDTIFNSLKKDYLDFENWFRKCSKTQVKAWVIKKAENNHKLQSICIYKEAKDEDYSSYNLPKKSLKLATFKVDESYRGKKLGELMLKQAFLYAVRNNYKSCWMTVFPKYEILIDFIKDFGFFEIGKTELGELIFKKEFLKPQSLDLTGLDFYIKHSPFYDDRENIKKYIIPIKEKYHKMLFPEYEVLFPPKEIQLSLFRMNYTKNEIPGNTIKKVYLCHSPIQQLKKGDLLFFYVSSPIQEIRSIGIIDFVLRSDDLKKVISYIGKRSVYQFSEIKKMTENKVLVIAFRFIKHIKQKVINLSTLRELNILSGPPQSIVSVNHYSQLKKLLK